MSQSKTVRVLVYTHPMVIFGAAALILVALAAVVVLVVAAVVAVYACVLFIVGESLWRQMSPPKPKKWLVTNLADLQPRPVLALGFHDIGERVSWPEEIRGKDLLACDFDEGLAVMDGEKRLQDVEFTPLKLNQTESPYGWTHIDLPTEPTPTAVLGHDEHGKGEIIDMTPADLPISSTLVKKANENREAKLTKAIDLVQAGESIRKAAKLAGVSESTLRGHIKRLRVPMQEVTT
jgi:helix-turn-helix, Psq domain